MKKLALIFLFYSSALSSQNVDSLLSVLKTAKPDTNKLNLLFVLVESVDDDKIWSVYNEEAYTLSQTLAESDIEKIKKRGKKGLGDALLNKGVLLELHSDVNRAVDYYNKSLKLFE